MYRVEIWKVTHCTFDGRSPIEWPKPLKFRTPVADMEGQAGLVWRLGTPLALPGGDMDKYVVGEIPRDHKTAVTTTENQTDPGPVQNSELVQAVRAVNAAELFGGESELTFVIDRRSQMALVRVVDKKSGEVVRQFPPEYVLRLSEELKRLMEGDDSADLRFGVS